MHGYKKVGTLSKELVVFGSVWNPESTRESKKIFIKENDFFMLGFTKENLKENQI